VNADPKNSKARKATALAAALNLLAKCLANNEITKARVAQDSDCASLRTHPEKSLPLPLHSLHLPGGQKPGAEAEKTLELSSQWSDTANPALDLRLTCSKGTPCPPLRKYSPEVRKAPARHAPDVVALGESMAMVTPFPPRQ